MPLGVYAAWRANAPAARLLMRLSMLGVVLPGFVVGPLLALVFGIYWPIFRVGGYEPGDPSFLVLPVVTLALPVAAYVARLTRDSMREVLRSNYIRTARAKGIALARRAVAACVASGADPGGELPRARGGVRDHRLAGGRNRCSDCPVPAASSCRAPSIATTRWSWA